MSMSNLRDKVVIVTGASSGIGEATALALGHRGASVILAARRKDRLEAIAARIGGSGRGAAAVACDVTRREQVESLARSTMDQFGHVDALINNAGIMPLSPLAKARIDEWDDTIDVNLKGALYAIGAVLPAMLERGTGHIVNISSVAGRRTFPNAAVYCATKFALHAISESLRSELAERSARDGNTVRVTIIAPGVVTTELPDTIADAEPRQNADAYYSSIREPLRSEDIAESIVYALEAPPHVNVNEILIRPTSQLR
jgi:NADP-dependent 3-hydroxy acid dehydrogenase YdfG